MCKCAKEASSNLLSLKLGDTKYIIKFYNILFKLLMEYILEIIKILKICSTREDNSDTWRETIQLGKVFCSTMYPHINPPTSLGTMAVTCYSKCIMEFMEL